MKALSPQWTRNLNGQSLWITETKRRVLLLLGMLKRVYCRNEKEYCQRQRHLGESRVDMTNTLCRERGKSGDQEAKRPKRQKGKKGKRTRVAEMTGLQREEQLGGGEVQTV